MTEIIAEAQQPSARSHDRTPVELSVVIVNWKSKEYLRSCISSLYRAGWPSRWEVIVIDNASYDGCREMLAAEFPAVRFFQSDENLGFAGANNAAFQQSRGRYILFLNPDTEVVGAAVATMLNVSQAAPGLGALGARLLNTDLTIQTSCIQRFPTILNQALDCEFLRKSFPKSAFFGMAPLYAESNEAAEVETISGACLMIRREAFEEIDGFTTDYFMYSEDVDLCYKLARSGRRNYYLPSAVVIHHGGKSTAAKESGFSSVVMRESRADFFRRNRGPLYTFTYRLSSGAVAAARLLSLAALYVLAFQKPGRVEVQGAVVRWFKVMRWSLGLEGWAGKLKESARLRAEKVVAAGARIAASQRIRGYCVEDVRSSD